MPKHVLIIGGHGKVSQLLTPILLKHHFIVTSLIRSQDQVATIEQLGADLNGTLKVLVQSLEDIKSVDAAKSVLDEVGPDYVVWSAGSGGKGGVERTNAIDRNAAINFTHAAAAAAAAAAASLSLSTNHKITRFINISHIGSRTTKPSWWTDASWDECQHFNTITAPAYFSAKLAADEVLRNESARSGGDGGFVGIVLRPGQLVDEPATGGGGGGSVDLGRTKGGRGKVSRANVAEVVAGLLLADGVRSCSLDLANGEESVVDAVARVVETKEDAGA